MKNTDKITKKGKLSNPIDKNMKGIKNHRKAASYLQAAAKNHLKAATHHQEGNHHKAAQSTLVAHGYVNLAKKAQKVDVKQHAIIG